MVKLYSPDSTKISHIASKRNKPNEWVIAHYDPNSKKQKRIRDLFRTGASLFDAEPASVQDAWNDFELASGKPYDGKAHYSRRYVYNSQRNLPQDHLGWTPTFHGIWNDNPNHLHCFFSSESNYLYWKTFQALNQTFSTEYFDPDIVPFGCITGTVYSGPEESKTPLSEVTVSICDHEERSELVATAQTDNNGVYHISYLPQRTYDVKFDKSGYIDSWVDEVSITSLQSLTLDCTLSLVLGSLFGTVFLNNTPTEGISISVYSQGEDPQLIGYTLSGTDGSYQILNIPSGTYNVDCNIETSKQWYMNVFVTSPDATELDCYLES